MQLCASIVIIDRIRIIDGVNQFKLHYRVPTFLLDELKYINEIRGADRRSNAYILPCSIPNFSVHVLDFDGCSTLRNAMLFLPNLIPSS